LILFFLKFDDLQTDFVLAQFFGFYLLLPFEFLDQEFGIVCLVVDLLVSALFFNAAQVDDVLSNAHSDCHRFLKVSFHLD